MPFEHSALRTFSKAADNRLSDNSYENFIALKERFNSLVFESDTLAQAANHELAAIASDRYHAPPLSDPHYLLIASNALWQLRVGLHTKNSELLYSSPFHLMVAVIGNEPLVVDSYSIPADFNEEIFSHQIRLGEPERHIYMPGSIVAVDSRKTIIDIVIERPILIVKFNTAVVANLQWAFLRHERTAVQAFSANSVDSELVSLARALGAMDYASATPSLIELTKHPRHFVRWAALQGLAQIAPDQAILLLQEATHDSHPHVRTAATHALSTLRPISA